MRRIVLLALALLASPAAATSAPPATHTYTSHQLHAAIRGGGTLLRTIPVPDAGPVSFVAVGVRILHPHDADLSISLVGPRGTEISLSRHEGGDGANFGTGAEGCSGNLTWFEDGTDPISTLQPPFAGAAGPDRPLGALYGEEARGRWTIRIEDSPGGAAGTLLCWQLELARRVRDHIRLTRDGVSADLSFFHRHSYDDSLTIAIQRRGVRELTAPIARFFRCTSCPQLRFDTIFGDPLHVADLDGDGEPEVLVDLYTGGAHCCFATVFLRFDGRRYRGAAHVWGNVDYHLGRLGDDGLELVSADDRFAYRFTSFAGSVFPVQIWRYDRGVLLDVTSCYRFAVRNDADRIWHEYLALRNRPSADVRGLLAAWVADEYRLGRAREAWNQVDAAYSRGELSAPRVDPLWPVGRKYLRALRSFLTETRYAQ